jgi:hypothetical protein
MQKIKPIFRKPDSMMAFRWRIAKLRQPFIFLTRLCR